MGNKNALRPDKGERRRTERTFAVPPCFCRRLATTASEGANTPRSGNGNTRRPLLTLVNVSRPRLARELPRTHTPVRTSHRLSDERNRAYFPRSMPYPSAIVTLSVHDGARGRKQPNSEKQGSSDCLGGVVQSDEYGQWRAARSKQNCGARCSSVQGQSDEHTHPDCR